MNGEVKVVSTAAGQVAGVPGMGAGEDGAEDAK